MLGCTFTHKAGNTETLNSRRLTLNFLVPQVFPLKLRQHSTALGPCPAPTSSIEQHSATLLLRHQVDCNPGALRPRGASCRASTGGYLVSHPTGHFQKSLTQGRARLSGTTILTPSKKAKSCASTARDLVLLLWLCVLTPFFNAELNNGCSLVIPKLIWEAIKHSLVSVNLCGLSCMKAGHRLHSNQSGSGLGFNGMLAIPNV